MVSRDFRVSLLDHDDRQRSTVNLGITTADGLSFAARLASTFARCVRAPAGFIPDGTWRGWEQADLLHADRPGQVELYGAPGWKGPQDISAVIRTMWDERFFYVGVETRDDVFSAGGHPAHELFLGDALEVGFDFEHAGSNDAVLWQFAAGLTPQGPAIYRHVPVPDGPVAVDTRRFIVKKTGVNGNAIHQIAIPWSAAGDFKPAPGKQIGFGVIVDDGDGVRGDRKFISWFGSGVSSKKPNNLGEIIFVER
ncbi:MAG: hypothetical protein LBK99_10800, partial [Opitutaceae bacterium]|nr:hypothetical protein [Opitutaceae bacterium]